MRVLLLRGDIHCCRCHHRGRCLLLRALGIAACGASTGLGALVPRASLPRHLHYLLLLRRLLLDALVEVSRRTVRHVTD